MAKLTLLEAPQCRGCVQIGKPLNRIDCTTFLDLAENQETLCMKVLPTGPGSGGSSDGDTWGRSLESVRGKSGTNPAPGRARQPGGGGKGGSTSSRG